jgi:hypothetical protein
VTAARTGVKTVLAEKNHFPGSVNTSGMMSSIGNYFLTRDGTQITYKMDEIAIIVSARYDTGTKNLCNRTRRRTL